jgi:hypothetical protein
MASLDIAVPGTDEAALAEYRARVCAEVDPGMAARVRAQIACYATARSEA